MNHLQSGMDLRKVDTWSLGQTLVECFDKNAGYWLKEARNKEEIFRKKKLWLRIENCSY